MASHRKQFAVSVGLWLFLAFFWGVLLTGTVSRDRARFERQTSRTVGRVIDKQPANHRLFRYEFVVNGQTYTASGLLEQPSRPRYEDYRVGDTVAVAYEPANPANACACDPVVAAQDEIGHPILWALVAATASAGLLQFVVWPRLLRSAIAVANTTGPPN